MKQINYFIIIFFLLHSFCLVATVSVGQDQKIADSLSRIYNERGNALPDREKLKLLRQLSFHETNDPNLALQYNYELIDLARKQDNATYLYYGYFQLASKKRASGDYPEAINDYLTSIKFAKSPLASANGYIGMGDVYNAFGNYSDAKSYYKQGITLLRNLDDSLTLASAILNEGEAFRNNKQNDSAILCYEEAGKIFDKLNHKLGKAYAVGNSGMVYANEGRKSLAEKNINWSIAVMQSYQIEDAVCEYWVSLAAMYLKEGDTSRALNYATRSFKLALDNQLKKQIADASQLLSAVYEKNGNSEEALWYFKTYIIYRDSLINIDNQRKIDDAKATFEDYRKQIQIDHLNRQKQQQKILLFSSLIVLAVIVGLVVVLMRSNRQKQKAYGLLSKEKTVTEEQRDLAHKTLGELKRTQAHLVQSEKMASLGQLTAGIAHEIQNPLNFVTNFSELNTELISELQEENRKGNVDAVDALSTELLNNAEKINYHGKRADAIVKGMLEHTRGGESEKKPTNINALVDEYFRLAYHSFRAKDKTFNLAMHTDFDPGIGEVNIVPQEIARVLLNLVNNAFYAVSARAGELPGKFEPTVTVSTKMQNNRVLISVRDNGTGISQQIKEKIFQPFYTTKGPGVGTGLGLYLSYEIVKSHGGEIKVDSEEGVGSEFTVAFPAS